MHVECPKCGLDFVVPSQTTTREIHCPTCSQAMPNPYSRLVSRPPSKAPVPDTISATPVVIVDVQMTIESMMMFMLKWAVASIPVALILGVVGGIVWFVVSAIAAGPKP